MTTILKFAAAAFIGSMMLSAPVAAAPISVAGTCTSAAGPTDFNGTTSGVFGCSKFDSNLGSLLSMTLSITGGITGTIDLTNTGATGPNFFGETSTRFFVGALSGFAFTSPMFTAAYDTGFQVQPGGTTTTYGTFNASNSQSRINTTSFGSYQNAGGLGQFGINVSTLTLLTCSTGGGNGGCSQVTDASASATVSYTYEDGTVTTPEPASMALLGAGMLALGAARRRRS